VGFNFSLSVLKASRSQYTINFPVMKRESQAYWNGKFVPMSEIRIDPTDLGVLRGYGVFDVMRTENGKPFLLERHFARLKRSADTLHLHLPVDEAAFRNIIEQLLQENHVSRATIRTVLTGGVSESCFLPEGRETFFITTIPFLALDEKYITEGAKVITLEHARHFPHAKITNYITAIEHAPHRLAQEALEVVFVNDSQVLEASTSNIMIVRDGVVITPKDHILKGITRGWVLELAAELGLPVEERAITLTETLSADEVFLTATNKYIVPVVQIDDHRIADGHPGTITKKLQQSVRESIKRY
jgi:branched-chain amino acid aminotransferase